MIGDLDNGAEIARHVDRLLRVADVDDQLPTPVDDIVAAAGLAKTNEPVLTESMIALAPKELRKHLRSAARKVVGLLDRRERVIQVAPTSSTGRESFITLHEVTHDILPWQRDLQVLGDTAQTLSPTMTLMFEREANQGGAELLFQLDLLKRVAADYPVDMTTAVVLADLFGASIHATFRRWIEDIESPVCGLVLDTTLGASQRRKRFEHVDSPSWVDQFGSRRFPSSLPVGSYAFASTPNGEGDFDLIDRDGSPVTLQWQTLTTPYRMFVLLWTPTRGSFISRHRRRPQLVIP